MSKKNNWLSLRLTDDELRRLERVYAKGKKLTKNEAKKTTMIRELIGLIPFNVLTEEDRLSLKADDVEKEVKKTGTRGAS